MDSRNPLLGFAPLQRTPHTRAAALSLRITRDPTPGALTQRQLAAPLLRFLPLQRLPSSRQRQTAKNAFLATCAFRLSQPPGAFIRPEPTRPSFMPDPLLGFPFRAFLLSRSRTLFPAPLTLLPFEPASGSCSTRESATRFGCLGQNRARSSPGLFPFRVLSRSWPDLHRASPLVVLCPSANAQITATPGSCASRAWPISFKDCRPS